MPNWVQNRLVITGDERSLNNLREQVNKPYDSHHYDVMSNSIAHDKVEGEFLLWNIIRPTNLNAYYEYEKHTQAHEKRLINSAFEPEEKQKSVDDMLGLLQERIASITQEDFENTAKQFFEDLQHGQDWYHWNVRNWGTKWEIDQARLVQEQGKMVFHFETAWSPPVNALNELAAQYPSLVMTLTCIDEGDMFASEVHWQNKKQVHEQEIAITHGLKEDMYGYCYACSDGNENDPDLEDYRKELRCAEFKATIEIEGAI